MNNIPLEIFAYMVEQENQSEEDEPLTLAEILDDTITTSPLAARIGARAIPTRIALYLFLEKGGGFITQIANRTGIEPIMVSIYAHLLEKDGVLYIPPRLNINDGRVVWFNMSDSCMCQGQVEELNAEFFLQVIVSWQKCIKGDITNLLEPRKWHVKDAIVKKKEMKELIILNDIDKQQVMEFFEDEEIFHNRKKLIARKTYLGWEIPINEIVVDEESLQKELDYLKSLEGGET